MDPEYENEVLNQPVSASDAGEIFGVSEGIVKLAIVYAKANGDDELEWGEFDGEMNYRLSHVETALKRFKATYPTLQFEIKPMTFISVR